MRKISFVKDGIYHVFNRGVEKRTIFLDESDRWRFLQGMYLFNDENSSFRLLWDLEHRKGELNFRVLKEIVRDQKTARKPLVKIMADCLMPNHYHFLLQEIKEGGISRFMHKLGVGYTNYFNKKYKRVGSLFQGTFKAVPVDQDAYLQYLLAYINVINPGQLLEPELKERGTKNFVGILKFAEEFLWSTNKEYLGTRESIVIDKGIAGEFFGTPTAYKAFIRDVLLGKKRFTGTDDLMID